MSQIHTLNAHIFTVNENFFETVCLSNDQNWRERQKKTQRTTYNGWEQEKGERERGADQATNASSDELCI